MSFKFTPATRENVGAIIGLAGPSGSGKTYSALELATGIAGDRPFAFIDTEARRALHYADRFKFDHGDLRPPFRPESYWEAIKAADDAGYPVIVVDSMSHEHAGEGGLLDWHEELLEKMAGDDWKRREACNIRAWVKPKMEHKRMVQRLLQVRSHLILCFRAEEKVKMVKEKGKTKIVDAGWQPICEKNLPYELTLSLLFDPERPGRPIPLKLQEQHRSLFPLDKCVGREAGQRIAEWAKGGTTESEDWAQILGMINGASTMEALKEVGAALARSKLTEAERNRARRAYKERGSELQRADHDYGELPDFGDEDAAEGAA